MSLGTLEPWTGAMINMLRVVIDDNAYQGSYTYSDARLRETLVVAAMFVCQDVDFAIDYTVDTIHSTISPDPYTEEDKVFMNMVVMKAACLIDLGHYRAKTFSAGLEARCGPAVLKTLNQLPGFKDLLALGPCKMYDDLKEEQKFSGDRLNSLIHFVLSPFVSDDFDPSHVYPGHHDPYRTI